MLRYGISESHCLSRGICVYLRCVYTVCVCVCAGLLPSAFLFCLEIFSVLTLVLGDADVVNTVVVEDEDTEVLLWFEHIFNVWLLIYAVVAVVTIAEGLYRSVCCSQSWWFSAPIELVNCPAQGNFSRTFGFDLVPGTLPPLHFWGYFMAFYRFIVRENDRPIGQL